jgi:DNA-binding MarR family transcriptional regulator
LLVGKQLEQVAMFDVEAATRLRRAVSRIARRLNVSATSEGLTPTQASVLGLICGSGPLSMARLAEAEGLNPTLLSRVVGALGDAGLIGRNPDPSDLRVQLVEATDAGISVNERIKSARAGVVSASAEHLSAGEVSALLQALPALEGLADQLDRTARPPSSQKPAGG